MENTNIFDSYSSLVQELDNAQSTIRSFCNRFRDAQRMRQARRETNPVHDELENISRLMGQYDSEFLDVADSLSDVVAEQICGAMASCQTLFVKVAELFSNDTGTRLNSRNIGGNIQQSSSRAGQIPTWSNNSRAELSRLLRSLHGHHSVLEFALSAAELYENLPFRNLD